MKRIIFWIMALAIATMMAMKAQAQNQTVRGNVCDIASGEPMIGVTITVES